MKINTKDKPFYAEKNEQLKRNASNADRPDTGLYFFVLERATLGGKQQL